MRPPALRTALAPWIAVLALGGLAGCHTTPGGGEPEAPGPGGRGAPDLAESERFARRMLEEARAFEAQGRHDAAERAARRGLEAAPHDAALTRALARAVEARGDAEAARALRERAGLLDPPPPDPPQLPVPASSRDVLVVLLRPDPGHADPDRVPRDWPDTVVAEALQRRLRVRLPEATLAYFEPESVADARRWLPRSSPRAAISLRVERAYCDSTIKDGRFAVGSLRVAAERPGPARDAPEVVREVVAEPRLPGGCRREAVSRALERVLELEQVQDALTAPALPPGLRSPVVQQAGWSRAAIRALFPDLGRRIQEEIDAARRWIASGHLAKAAETLLRAAHIDPDDPDVRAYLSEVDATLLLASEIAPDAAEPGVLDPRFTPAQRAAVESRLREERRRREDLLAALAVLDEDVQVPGPRTLRALRPVEIRDADAFGPALARARAGTAIEARAAYAPDGSLLSVYFFPESAALPVLREEDTSGDARPDRWIGYDQGVRSEIWEDARGAGQPSVRVVFASGGRELERIELDSDADGRLDHVFRYADGALAGESRDKDGDGQLDTFDRFDAAGQLVLREEDLDGDGRIDVRSVFRAGRLVRREISDPAHAPDGT